MPKTLVARVALLILIGTALGGVAFAAGASRRPDVPEVVRARKLEVVDDSGRVRMALSAKNRAALDLFDLAGTRRAS